VAFQFPSSGDQKLIQIVDAALADAARKSAGGLVCRKGCTACCIGVFAINQLDALRLRRGMAELAARDPERATAVRQRAGDSVALLSRDFPGDPVSGLLGKTKEQRRRFEDFANEEPCPALDPDVGTCDLYDSRPMTCRTFGPPVHVEEGGLGVCELCYHGFSEKEIAACAMIPDPEDLESRILKEVEKGTGRRGDTIIAFPLAA
jgi:Fe-S-cluster containining protein